MVGAENRQVSMLTYWMSTGLKISLSLATYWNSYTMWLLLQRGKVTLHMNQCVSLIYWRLDELCNVLCSWMGHLSLIAVGWLYSSIGLKLEPPYGIAWPRWSFCKITPDQRNVTGKLWLRTHGTEINRKQTELRNQNFACRGPNIIVTAAVSVTTKIGSRGPSQ